MCRKRSKCNLHFRGVVRYYVDMIRKLTKQQEGWCRHYVATNFNATEAAVLAGYAPIGAQTRGYELSHNPVVLMCVARLVEAANKRSDINADYVRRRVAEMDALDIRDLIGDDGRILPIKQWSSAWGRSISGIDFGDLIIASQEGDDRKMIQLIKKIKWPDKLKTIELLGKHVNVKAWEKEAGYDDETPPSMTITFEVSDAKAEVQITNAKT